MIKKRDMPAVLLGTIVAIILWVAVLSRDAQTQVFVFSPFHSILSAWREIQRVGLSGNFLGNIVLFVPVGFLVSFVINYKNWIRVLLIGIGFSLSIELIQLITKRGCFDPDDILLNTVGMMIGYGVYCLINRMIICRVEQKNQKIGDRT